MASLSDYAVSTGTKAKLRGTLGGFSFMPKRYSFEEIMPLFKDLPARLERGNPVQCLEEIVKAAMDGRIDLDSPFNLSGYEYKVLHNEERNKVSRRKGGKNKPAVYNIDFMPSDEDGAAAGCMGVDQVSYAYYEQQKSAEDEIADLRDVMSAVDYIHLVRTDFMVYENVDIISLLKSALNGSASAESVKKLAFLTSKYKKFSENIKILLTSGKSLCDLFPEGE